MFSLPIPSFTPIPSSAWAVLLTVLYVVLAATVTADVLLKKSDVRGALGWIGAVWFAPIFGSLLYYLFGINRVTRRALKLGRLNRAQTHVTAPAEPKAAPNMPKLAERFSGAVTSVICCRISACIPGQRRSSVRAWVRNPLVT